MDPMDKLIEHFCLLHTTSGDKISFDKFIEIRENLERCRGIFMLDRESKLHRKCLKLWMSRFSEYQDHKEELGEKTGELNPNQKTLIIVKPKTFEEMLTPYDLILMKVLSTY